MTWTWDEIDANWLGDSVIAEDPGVVLEAFKRIDMTLGPDWIDNYRADRGGGDHRGAGLTLPLVILGKQLAQIEGAAGCEGLVRGLRDGRPNARAELDAISLLMEGPGDIRLECEPSVLVGGRERKADFRVSKVHEEWVYGEVTQPNRSATEESLTRAMDEVADVVSSLDGSYATEVFFDKSPTPEELRAVRPVLEEVCRRGEDLEQALPNQLGVVYVGQTAPGMVTLDDHRRPYRPGIGIIKVFAGASAHRHAVVRVPFFDERAHHFVATESGQLPDDSPGLIMIQMSEPTGGMKKWAPTLQDELQIDMYRNVSAVCLFASGFVGTERGEAANVETVVCGESWCSAPPPGVGGGPPNSTNELGVATRRASHRGAEQQRDGRGC